MPMPMPMPMPMKTRCRCVRRGRRGDAGGIGALRSSLACGAAVLIAAAGSVVVELVSESEGGTSADVLPTTVSSRSSGHTFFSRTDAGTGKRPYRARLGDTRARDSSEGATVLKSCSRTAANSMGVLSPGGGGGGGGPPSGLLVFRTCREHTQRWRILGVAPCSGRASRAVVYAARSWVSWEGCPEVSTTESKRVPRATSRKRLETSERLQPVRPPSVHAKAAIFSRSSNGSVSILARRWSVPKEGRY
ncbi:hypothetical protein C8Q76DRAFT_763290, partial [Earliella scabrosa]